MTHPLTTAILILLTLLSLGACAAAAVRLRRPAESRRASEWQQGLIAAVGLGAAALFAYRWALVTGRWQPLAAHVDGLLLIVTLLAGVMLFIQWRPRLFGLSAFATPVLSFLLAWAVCASAWTYRPFNLETLHPVWMAVHLGGVYLGTLASALAAVAGVTFLYVQRRLKHKANLGTLGRLASLETLETLIVRAATLGFALLTLGLVSGVIILTDESAGHANLSGRDWVWKIALAVAAWVVYALLMNVRYATAFRGARAAWLSIAGLVLLLAVYGIVTAMPTLKAQSSTSDTRSSTSNFQLPTSNSQLLGIGRWKLDVGRFEQEAAPCASS